jgi:hypothetical protein
MPDVSEALETLAARGNPMAVARVPADALLSLFADLPGWMAGRNRPGALQSGS